MRLAAPSYLLAMHSHLSLFFELHYKCDFCKEKFSVKCDLFSSAIWCLAKALSITF